MCGYETTCSVAHKNFYLDFTAKNNSHHETTSCGIEPSQIKAIWNDKFQNTLLATKEFEERLQVIYASCNSKILNLYLNNMDKNIHEIDLMASKVATGKEKKSFKQFAARKEGKVKMNSSTLKSLNAYYQKKSLR